MFRAIISSMEKLGNYDENSTPNPKSFYGREKLASENALIASGVEHTIIRPMIIYGNGTNVKPNFALWLIDQLSNEKPVTIVDDQFGMPTIVMTWDWQYSELLIEIKRYL